MKNLLNLIAFTFLIFSATSCQKDKSPSPIAIPSTYNFVGASTTGNTYYGFDRVDGENVRIPAEDIDLTIFAEYNETSTLDKLNFTSNNELSYLAFNEFDDGQRTETVPYELNNNTSVFFDLLDEWGNDYSLELFINDNELRLRTYGYVEVRDGEIRDAEVYPLSPNQVVFEEEVENRAFGLDNGNQIYMIIYEQIFEVE